VNELDHDSLIELIVGRQVEEYTASGHLTDRDIALSVRELTGEALAELDFDVRHGETVGVTGLVGSGHEEVLPLIFSSRPRKSGTVTAGGRNPTSPRGSIAAGMAFVPADRQRLSGIPAWSVRENLTLPRLNSSRVVRWMSDKREVAESYKWLDRLDVQPRNPASLLSTLSGGNQQKVVLARWLRCGAKVFLLEEPTNGVDIGARQAIYRALADAASEGAAILMSSTDAEELASVCDRVIVLNYGRVGTVLQGPALTADRITVEVSRVHPRVNTPEVVS
jgi:ribose transport system ATP-binding protein